MGRARAAVVGIRFCACTLQSARSQLRALGVSWEVCRTVSFLFFPRGIHEQMLGLGCKSNMPFSGVVWPIPYTRFDSFHGLSTGSRNEQVNEVYQAMKRGVPVSSTTFHHLLQRCIREVDLDMGRQVHSLITSSGLQSNSFLGHQLICMYSTCGCLRGAQDVFRNLPSPDRFVWCAVILAHCKHGESNEAINLYSKMRQSYLVPDEYVFVAVLKACANAAALSAGKRIHGDLLEHGFESNAFVSSALVDMYVRCNCVEEARKVFDRLSTRDVVNWNAMLAGYAQHGYCHEALELFGDMQEAGMQPNQRTLVSILKACSSTEALDEGKVLHSLITKCGFEKDVFVGSTLINMYAKCGSLGDARSVFDRMPKKNSVSWNAMIAGYAHHANGLEAMSLFQQMQMEGLQPDHRTVVSMLKACSSIAALDQGRLLHGYMMETGSESDIFVSSILIDMYARCGSLEDGRRVFESLPARSRDVVIWNVMIAAYAEQGCVQEAFRLLRQMQAEGLQPDQCTFVGLLNGCSIAAAVDLGKLLHALISESGYVADEFVGNTLVDMYAKCGNVQEARKVFTELVRKNSVTWNSMIAGYIQEGSGQEAINLFQQMLKAGIQPDQATLASILKACSTMAALGQGKMLHAYIVESGFDSDLIICSCLIDMYAKCGSLDDAQRLFVGLSTKNLVSWNAMISGCAQHGHAQEALDLFGQMREAGVQPDSITFVSLLSACSHAGLLSEGRQLFQSMTQDFSIPLELDHYACMVDLLGRSGYLEEAADLISSMTLQPHLVIWKSLLSACRTHGRVQLGRRSFEAILRLDRTIAAPYILMADIYSAAGMFDEEAQIRKQMLTGRVLKEPGRTWIESNDEVHIFMSQDQRHPERRLIYAELRRLMQAYAWCKLKFGKAPLNAPL